MDPSTAYRRRAELLFLDVREPWEWQAGRIDGALHIPMEALPERLDDVEDARTVLCVCRTGQRSEMVAQWLRAQGYDAHNLDGGVADWAACGLPFDGEVV
jgi:rhodanese-related sulfurtransferase